MINGHHAVVEALKRMKPREKDRWMIDNVRYFDWLLAQAYHFPSFALPDIGNPSVICGIVHSFGRGEVWMVTGEDFKAQSHHTLPMQRQICRSMYRALQLHRMSLCVDAGSRSANKWAKSLGFRYETDLEKAGARAENLSVYVWPDQQKGN